MRRLSTISAITVLFVATTSLGYAATTVKSSKSNSQDAAPAGAVPGKDPCADHKNDTNKYGACQKAARLGSSQVGGGQGQKVSVCSGGYWWTGGWGGWTQGGSCSPEGAIK